MKPASISLGIGCVANQYSLLRMCSDFWVCAMNEDESTTVDFMKV